MNHGAEANFSGDQSCSLAAGTFFKAAVVVVASQATCERLLFSGYYAAQLLSYARNYDIDDITEWRSHYANSNTI